MSRLCLVVAVLTVLLARDGLCGSVEVPLPSLCGTYTTAERARVAAFDLGAPVDTILDGWIHWYGAMAPGLAEHSDLCFGAEDLFEWPTEFIAEVNPPSPGGRYALVGPYDSWFMTTTRIQNFSGGTPDWSPVLGGSGFVRFEIKPSFLVCATGVESPVVMIDEAVLILDTLRTTLAVPDDAAPPVTRLFPPAPSPMRGSTVLRYSVVSPGTAFMDILDVSGRIVRHLIDGRWVTGRGAMTWDGTDGTGTRVRPGIYVCRFVAGGVKSWQRLVVLD